MKEHCLSFFLRGGRFRSSWGKKFPDRCGPEVCKFLTDFDYYLITRRTSKKEKDIQGFDLFPVIEQQDAQGNVDESTHLYISNNLKS